MDQALKTAIWVAALVRRVEVGGASAFVMRKGDPDAGAVVVKVAKPNRQASLYAASQDADGARRWLAHHDADAAIEAQIQRRLTRDSDLWVIEIEDRDGRHFLTEPVVEGA